MEDDIICKLKSSGGRAHVEELYQSIETIHELYCSKLQFLHSLEVLVDKGVIRSGKDTPLVYELVVK